MLANMLSPPANLALCLTLLPCVMSGNLVGSPHRSLRVESQFLAFDKSSGVENYDPFAEEHFYGHLKCGVTVQVGSKDHKFEMCPDECPYYAQDLDDDLHCSFVCVSATECGTRNPKRPIADVIKGHKTCRGPMVSDCEDYNYDGTDSCKKCQLFYSVGGDGLCHFDHVIVIYVVIVVFLVVTIYLLMWLVDCCSRPNKNPVALKKGETFRSLQKIRSHEGELYPMDTNLCNEDVAGPGMLLHFNMQVFIIIWAFAVACTWLVLAITIDNALFLLGTRRFGTPRENCILVAWGYETQQRLMWTKVTFLVITYTFTFIFTLFHAIRQQSIFEKLDAKEKTMKDFMAFLTGLPPMKADDKDAEKKVQDFLEEKGVKGVVGVSIAWNYTADQEKVELYLEKEMLVRDKKYQKEKWQDMEEAKKQENLDKYKEGMGIVRKFFYGLEQKFLGGFEEENSSEWSPETQKAFLGTIVSSEDAFVVFETEDERDGAVDAVDANGGSLGAFTDGENSGDLTLHKMVCEPDTIYWHNFGGATRCQQACRLLQGFGCILLALFFWTTVFYAPYAYQVFCFNYDNGAQPPFTLALTFCMVVVLGNAIMYEVCAQVSDFVGFKTRDERESIYLILYVIACMFNVLLDMVTTYFLAEYILDGLGFRTYFGVRFSDVPTFTERFETYAMQRMLAENTKAYAFPATFLIPFLIEPFVTVIVPYYLGKVMVRSHPEWVGRDAEKMMAAWEFDMGRYGDLLLDMVLGILIFFFPGGYTLILFFGMAGSHSYIYGFDHARVLGTIPKCIYASIDVDWWGCWMMAPITAMIPMCLVFKANCQNYGFCIKGPPLIEAMWLAFFLHAIIHTLLLVFVVPLFKPEVDDENAGTKYATAAEEYPCNWFTSNPIHCLRSQHLSGLGETEFCTFHTLGKAHIHNQSAKAGLYYNKAEGKSEEFVDFTASVKGLFKKKKQEAPQDGQGQ